MNDQTTTQPVEAIIWQTLSKIDVGEHIETKGDRFKLSYLSWTWAWAELMKHFPVSHFTTDSQSLDDGTMMVRTDVAISVETDGVWDTVTRFMWLPVMDHKNNAIANPTARDISDATMRCLVKNLAMFGLGLDVYAGSDIPVGSIDDPISEDQLDLLSGLLAKAGADLLAEEDEVRDGFLKWIGVENVNQVPRGRFKSACTMLERKIKLLEDVA